MQYQTAPLTIVNVGYLSTNYWVVGVGKRRILIDIGYPGTMGMMRANLKRKGIALDEIRYALATHYHIDHAGLGQELKNAGVPLVVLESQIHAIPLMKRWTKPQDHYVEIVSEGNIVISFLESRSMLESLGIAGEILPTPGHSDDSVSLILDNGSAFIGDLIPPTLADGERAHLVYESWTLLEQKGAKKIYPAHGATWILPSRFF